MLARVDVRSRPAEDQFVEKTEGPNGPAGPVKYWLRCGIEPARNRDKRAELLARFCCSLISPSDGDGDLNGLCEGVGREVFATSDGRGPKAFVAPPGENLDGTVPALARLVCGKLSGVGRPVKSGKPSVGDSGMFSRRGVELPLVGGPQTLTGRPSCAWISRALCGEG